MTPYIGMKGRQGLSPHLVSRPIVGGNSSTKFRHKSSLCSCNKSPMPGEILPMRFVLEISNDGPDKAKEGYNNVLSVIKSGSTSVGLMVRP